MEDEKPKNGKTKNIFFLFSKWMRGDDIPVQSLYKHLGLIAMIVVLVIFYVDNRYTVQQQQIKIDKLKRELMRYKYIDLTRSSELMEQSRQSKIEEYVQKNNSDLQTSTEPPFVIIGKTEDN